MSDELDRYSDHTHQWRAANFATMRCRACGLEVDQDGGSWHHRHRWRTSVLGAGEDCDCGWWRAPDGQEHPPDESWPAVHVTGGHTNPEHDLALLRDELDAARREIERLRGEVHNLEARNARLATLLDACRAAIG